MHYFSINRSRLVEQMKKGTLSLATDGSNDEDLVKLNPLLVKLFENDLGCVHVQLLGICCSKSGTAEILFENMSNALRSNEIDWSNCVGQSLDNTSVNLGRHNSVKKRVQEVNKSIYINGCPFTTRQMKVLRCLCWKMVLMLRICLLTYSNGLIKAQKEKSS